MYPSELKTYKNNILFSFHWTTKLKMMDFLLQGGRDLLRTLRRRG